MSGPEPPITFDMPLALGYEVHRYSRNLDPLPMEQATVAIIGELDQESMPRQLTVSDGGFVKGDIAIVSSIGAADGDSLQRRFRVERSPSGDLAAVVEQDTTLFAVESDGKWRTLGTSEAFVGIDGTLANDQQEDLSYVARMETADTSRVVKWSNIVNDDGQIVPEVDFDVRAFDSTEAAYDSIQTATDLTDRTVIEVVGEEVVGVVIKFDDKPFVLAVTEEAGQFEKIESSRDVELTVAAGTDPEVFKQGLIQARLGGLPIAPAITQGVTAMNRSEPDLTVSSAPAHEIATEDRITAVEGEYGVGWNPERESFIAVNLTRHEGTERVSNVEVHGTKHDEFPTAAALITGLSDKGIDLAPELTAKLADLEQERDGPRFVGVSTENGPALALVSESNRVELLAGRGEHSPDGPNWGYEGNGPREAASMMAGLAVGESAATPAVKGRLLHDVVSGLPAEFSVPAKDISAFITNGTAPNVSTGDPDLAATRGFVAAASTDIDIRGVGLEVEMGDMSL